MAVALPEVAAIAVPRATMPARAGVFARFAHNLDVVLPAGVLILMIFSCFIGPALFHIIGPIKGSLLATNLPPFSPGHILGTDQLGDDEMSRLLFGGRISIEVGFSSVGIGVLIGGVLGTIAGYYGGITETLIMRVLDVLLAFPALVLAMAIATYLGQSEHNVIIAIAFFTVPAFSRLARASTLKMRQQDFVVAGRLAGRSGPAMIVRHVAPNILPQMMTFGLLTVAAAMLIEAALSFLGLGVPPPQPTWGGMISAGQNVLSTESYLVLEPGLFLLVTVLSLNRLGDALRSRWASA